MLRHSGIGRYLEAICLRRTGRDRPVRWLLAGGVAGVRHGPADQTRIIGSNIYSIGEQFDRLDEGTVMWTPHYNFPVLSPMAQIVTYHDLAHLALPEIFGWGLKRVYAWLYLQAAATRADHVFFDSHFTRMEFGRLAGRMPRTYSVIPLGVDRKWFRPARPRKRAAQRSILFVGNAKPHKNLGRLIEALTPLGVSGRIKLRMVGQMSGFRTSDPLAALGTCAWVERHGLIDDEQLIRLYETSDCFVMPSLYEGFGLPVLEAMAAGCPVVCSTASALLETCGGQEAGLAEFFDPRDVPGIRAAVERVLFSPVEEIGVRCARAQTHAAAYTWEKTAEQVWHTIDQLAAHQAGTVL